MTRNLVLSSSTSLLAGVLDDDRDAPGEVPARASEEEDTLRSMVDPWDSGGLSACCDSASLFTGDCARSSSGVSCPLLPLTWSLLKWLAIELSLCEVGLTGLGANDDRVPGVRPLNVLVRFPVLVVGVAADFRAEGGGGGPIDVRFAVAVGRAFVVDMDGVLLLVVTGVVVRGVDVTDVPVDDNCFVGDFVGDFQLLVSGQSVHDNQTHS